MKKKTSGGKQRNSLRDKRRFRGGRSFPIPLWNGILEHRKKIGSAFWEFAWCLDRITREENGIGFVNGGAPVKAKTIARDFNKVGDKALDEDTVRINLKKLQEEGYLRLRRTPYGQVIEVMNSLKFGIWAPCERTREKPYSLAGESGKARTPESGKTRTPESGKTPETKKTQQSTCSKVYAAKKKERVPALYEEGFKTFWEEYPRKEAKQKAADAWKKINPKEVPAIMAGLKRLKGCEQWTSDGGKFVPHPATFLNGRRWEDKPRNTSTASPRQNLGPTDPSPYKEINRNA
jgi:hypothetical protein